MSLGLIRGGDNSRQPPDTHETQYRRSPFPKHGAASTDLLVPDAAPEDPPASGTSVLEWRSPAHALASKITPY